MIRRALSTAAFSGVLLCVSTLAHATTITIAGADTGLTSTGTIVVDFNAQTNALTFTITNTSAITTPGSTSTMTGIGFDLPPLGNASASGLNGFTGMQAPSLLSDFVFSDADVGAVPLFNNVVLDFGFITGSSFAEGTVDDGLLPGESASFSVSGAAFIGFTEEQIANALFVGFQNVPTARVDVGTTQQPVPEPASLVLLGLGLTGVAARRRQQRTLHGRTKLG